MALVQTMSTAQETDPRQSNNDPQIATGAAHLVPVQGRTAAEANESLNPGHLCFLAYQQHLYHGRYPIVKNLRK